MKSFLRLSSSFMLLCTLVAGWVAYGFFGPGPLEEPVTVVFPEGTHFLDIADTLGQQKIIAHPMLFKILVILRGESSRFKAGEYIFTSHISAHDVSHEMASGHVVVHHLTIPEGLMTSEVLDTVRKADALEGEITLDVKEGELLPETYNYSRGEKRNDLIARMQHAMHKALDEAWVGRADNLPLATEEQALTLASIVEKETGLASERPRVAAVYINRLRKGMLLQADPTTAYAITQGKHKMTHPLTSGDLMMESPYNTYRTPGLPPGPIANPGKVTLLATLHPAASEELFFVATGTGGHNFARTPAEHAENVRKYRERQEKSQASH